jgi:hypothetical protein
MMSLTKEESRESKKGLNTRKPIAGLHLQRETSRKLKSNFTDKISLLRSLLFLLFLSINGKSQGLKRLEKKWKDLKHTTILCIKLSLKLRFKLR